METYDPKKNREQFKARAKSLQSSGFTVTEIASELGIHRQTARFLIDEEAYQISLKKGREYNVGARIRIKEATSTNAESRIKPEVFAARIAEIPADTRSKTGIIMGDPLPARSALAMRQQSEKVIPLRRAS